MTEREIRKKYKVALEEEARKKEVAEMKSGAAAALKSIEEQRRIWYENYRRQSAAGDFKQANWSFNMFKFMQKIYALTNRYVEILNAQTAIGDVFNMLRATNKSFSRVAQLSSNGLTRSVIRNLKKFKKSIARFTDNSDRIMKVFDSLFDEKKKRGKKNDNAPSDEEIFRANVEANQSIVSDFESQTGIVSTVSPSGSTRTGGGRGTGGTVTGGIGDPNDF